MKIEEIDRLKTTNQPPFVVPEGYFDDIEERVMRRIAPDTPKVVRLWPRIRYFAAAAVVLLASVAAWRLLADRQPAYDGLSDESIAIWSYGLDQTAMMAYELGQDTVAIDTCCTAEQETAIITFLKEHDVPVNAIILSMNELK